MLHGRVECILYIPVSNVNVCRLLVLIVLCCELVSNIDVRPKLSEIGNSALVPPSTLSEMVQYFQVHQAIFYVTEPFIFFSFLIKDLLPSLYLVHNKWVQGCKYNKVHNKYRKQGLTFWTVRNRCTMGICWFNLSNTSASVKYSGVWLVVDCAKYSCVLRRSCTSVSLCYVP